MFLSTVNDLRTIVNVVPEMALWNFTVWSTVNTTGAVYATLAGRDSQQRVWTSPEVQLAGPGTIETARTSLLCRNIVAGADNRQVWYVASVLGPT